jgi:hypothetical protein
MESYNLATFQRPLLTSTMVGGGAPQLGRSRGKGRVLMRLMKGKAARSIFFFSNTNFKVENGNKGDWDLIWTS